MKKIQPRKWLKDLRRELGLKIAEFSKRTVLSFPSFQKLESGETVNMKPETIYRIAKASDEKVENLVKEENRYREETGPENPERLVWVVPGMVEGDTFVFEGEKYIEDVNSEITKLVKDLNKFKNNKSSMMFIEAIKGKKVKLEIENYYI